MIYCEDDPVGTLQAMPLFHHIYRKEEGKIVQPADPDYGAATGIGAALHFRKTPEGAGRGANAPRCFCDAFKFIQVVDTTHDTLAGGQTGPRTFVDINLREYAEARQNDPKTVKTPYYGDWAGNRVYANKGEIPPNYPDAGKTVDTEVSMYDRPARDPAAHLQDRKDFRWTAETRLVCIRNGVAGKILGGVSYGFTRKFDLRSGSYQPIQDIAPKCLDSKPSEQFEKTLSEFTSAASKSR
jgi:hypothetical protein